MTLEQAPLTGGVRFAPSPTGRFHIGNLRTAWISHRLSRSLGRPWVVRMEDIDIPRVLAGAREHQLEDMAELGLVPDWLLTQSRFRNRHWSVFRDAVSRGAVYPCDCSRKDVQTALSGLASAPHDGVAPVYSGRCRSAGADRQRSAVDSLAWRFRSSDPSGREDFIVARSGLALDRDGIPEVSSFVPAYHWACAIDDFDGGYELLVRAIDLASAAPLQRAIQTWLGGPTACLPALFHTSLVVRNDGHRLEKRTRGVTLPELKQVGFSVEKIVLSFSVTFAFEADRVFAPGETASEENPSLTISQLGF